jgi:hypothetical protein
MHRHFPSVPVPRLPGSNVWICNSQRSSEISCGKHTHPPRGNSIKQVGTIATARYGSGFVSRSSHTTTGQPRQRPSVWGASRNTLAHTLLLENYFSILGQSLKQTTKNSTCWPNIWKEITERYQMLDQPSKPNSNRTFQQCFNNQ